MSKASAAEELANVRRYRAAERQRPRWRESQLDRYVADLLALRAEGATLADLQTWLNCHKRCRVHRSTISRWLHRRGHA